jgi:HAD superfamily hydrolase (TIGR01490 family)
MTEIALYDFDRTITKRPTYIFFLLHAARRHAPLRLMLIPAAILVSIGYLFGLVSRARLKEINQALLIGERIDRETLAGIAESFAERTLAENVHPQALARLAADRAAGRRLVLVTASYAFYVVPIARRLGFDDVIATGSRRDEDGNVLARIDGENCYARAKLAMVEQWMAREGLERDGLSARFYSDSPSDLPVFDWCDEPVAVNPTAKLRRVAEQRGWPVIAWG